MARNKKSKNNKKAATSGISYGLAVANQAKSPTLYRASAPSIVMNGNGLVIRNQEMWRTITSSASSDTLSRVGLNPADANVFNWLAGIADRYTYYRWRKLRIVYGSMCPSTQLGDVTMGLFYDREDLDAWFTATGTALAGLTQTVGASSGPVWGSVIRRAKDGVESDIMAVADVARAHMRTPWHLIDHSTASTALDNQAVAVFLGMYKNANGSGSLPCGRLWFDYEIELAHPTSTSANASTLKRGWDPAKDEVLIPSPYLPKPPAPSKPIAEGCEDEFE